MVKTVEQVEVEVLTGTINDGKKDFGPGKKLKMNKDEAIALSKGRNAVVRLVNADDEDSTGELSLEERQAAIIGAIGQLEKGNEAHWLKDGVTPEVEALNAILQWEKPVTAKERDVAWAAMNQA